jgi:hypothetical protein
VSQPSFVNGEFSSSPEIFKPQTLPNHFQTSCMEGKDFKRRLTNFLGICIWLIFIDRAQLIRHSNPTTSEFTYNYSYKA